MPRASRASQSSSPYDVHPGVALMQKFIVELPDKTGRTLEEWIALVKKNGPPTEKERRAWLKEMHGLGTNASWWIAEAVDQGSIADSDPQAYLKSAAEHVEAMYAGGKAGLRPIHDELLKIARKLGKDVRVCPCQTIVPLYRKHVFAQLKPTTRTRLDLGLALQDTEATGRLIDTGGRVKKDRITHRIPLTCMAEIDDDVKRWLKQAYDMDA
jgi:hypothetical protein